MPTWVSTKWRTLVLAMVAPATAQLAAAWQKTMASTFVTKSARARASQSPPTSCADTGRYDAPPLRFTRTDAMVARRAARRDASGRWLTRMAGARVCPRLKQEGLACSRRLTPQLRTAPPQCGMAVVASAACGLAGDVATNALRK